MLAFAFLLVFTQSGAQGNVYADFHVHSMLKPYYSGWNDIWEFKEHECPTEAYSIVLEKAGSVPKFTQSNFESLLLGNVRLAYLSLTPLEYEMRHPKIFHDLEKLRNSYACMAGVTPSWGFFLDKKVNYFDELMGSVEMLAKGHGQPYVVERDTFRYEVISSAAQLGRVLNNEQLLGVVLSIEGAHALGQGPLTEELIRSSFYEEEILENLEVLKGTRPYKRTGAYFPFPVCIMTLNHFMWNGLSGHAKTFGQVEGYFLDQSQGMNTGVTPLGEKVIAKMLDKESGRRILIDVKHMSIESRKWYYDYLRDLHLKGDTVPVVATHATVSGESWTTINPARNGNGQNKSSWLNQMPISMFDEDIVEIYLSRGMIGLMLDKYRVGGNKGNALVDESRAGSVQRRTAYVHLLVANMLEIVDVIKCKEAWDIISIGSDFDGMISAMETYDQAIKMPSLREDLLAYFNDPVDLFDLFPKRKVQRYMYGMSAEEIVDKVMGGNLVAFTERIMESEVAGQVSQPEGGGR